MSAPNNVLRNKVVVTSVCMKRGRQFGFGVIMEPVLRTVFFPHWIVKAFDISEDDYGQEFDCLFIDQVQDRHPIVIGILDQEATLHDTVVVGTYTGRPGQPDFSATITNLNRSS